MAVCKTVGSADVGSNPTAATTFESAQGLVVSYGAECGCEHSYAARCAQYVPKLSGGKDGHLLTLARLGGF